MTSFGTCREEEKIVLVEDRESIEISFLRIVYEKKSISFDGKNTKGKNIIVDLKNIA